MPPRHPRPELEAAEPAAEPAAELPRVARLWPELAGVPWSRVVAEAIADAPLIQSHCLVVMAQTVLPDGPQR